MLLSHSPIPSLLEWRSSMRRGLAPSASMISADCLSRASSHRTPAATRLTLSSGEYNSCSDRKQKSIIHRPCQTEGKDCTNPLPYICIKRPQHVRVTWTNRGMVSMLAMVTLLTGSLAMICRAPVLPSTISSILTPSWEREREKVILLIQWQQ